eukprot:CAMPEP_0174731002 /NCGR_PEP_ID=MMETSP1094-20130205/56683_1 /TAXON_ID=156173 /ORGANISM="Chrysochromulina brevifilum, Strain UTEX LB 985" /LENGTH=106 /DNA_ID=CAMNT_0015933341 /DNA_START=118 /DNA_END=439 /DNA_ORIENTATION=+
MDAAFGPGALNKHGTPGRCLCAVGDIPPPKSPMRCLHEAWCIVHGARCMLCGLHTHGLNTHDLNNEGRVEPSARRCAASTATAVEESAIEGEGGRIAAVVVEAAMP